MSEDKSILKASKTAEIPKVQDGEAVPSILPFYLSWYRCVFSLPTPGTGDKQTVPTREDTEK